VQFVSYMTPGFPVSLFETLARVMGAELHLEQSMSGPSPGDDPFADGRFDFGWICSTSFVDLALGADEPSVRLAGVAWVPDDPDAAGRPVYFGDIVVRPETDLYSLADLAGRRIGCNDPVSMSGHHALRLTIEDEGHDPDDFAELTFTGGHHASLDQLLAGDLDAAIVDSVVRIGRSRHDPAVAGLRVVRRTGPWPVQPLVARCGLADDAVAAARRALLAANEHPEMAGELDTAALTRLVPVSADHYQPVHRALGRSRG